MHDATRTTVPYAADGTPAADAAGAIPLTVDVYSDAICPWCYVGKRRLERALAAVAGRYAVTVRWHPVELNPDMPAEGMDRRAYRSAKFGSWARSQAMDAQVAAAGRAEGLTFAHDRMARTPNTRAAHRLVWFAATQGREDAVVEALFRAYFTEGRDIGSAAVLTAVAGEAGLDVDAVRELLAGDGGEREVRAAEVAALAVGVQGVPLVVIDGVVAVSGAQPPDVFVAAFAQAAATRTARAAASVVPSEGGGAEQAADEGCGPDGCDVAWEVAPARPPIGR